ncbi:60S ribosomal protein L13a-1 [Pyrus ussuriensis x Pyrus communis]|uniref:60S ribosomal protein L13a-1 n=1 Tax=Pyrus ussuriensis x Pyrus communis TaxID=2448454 RepID=A0A5N5G328_9ROSA|nr:60S ribosomal protein L13a-1 [Pyrus ussuriensis x Pyrus communis]
MGSQGICAKRVVVVPKDLLNGQPTAVVRAEQIAISGGLVRQKLKYMKFLRKRMNTQPSPAKIFWRNVRGDLRLLKGHKYCLLGQLSSEELENKRKEMAQVAYERKKQLTKLRLKAENLQTRSLVPSLNSFLR